MAEREQDPPEILEQGDIYFAYRPKVRPAADGPKAHAAGEPKAHAADENDEEVAAEGLDEVENFYLVLKPRGGPFRLINIGRKRVPDIDGHERNWGFVDTVARSGKEIEEALRRETYETKTRGPRLRPAARPAGEGVYALVRDGSKTYLAWALELPEQPGAVQEAFNIPEEASLAISIKNPEKGNGPPDAQLPDERTPEYPGELQEVFRDRRFAGEDPRLLDFAGAQIVFVGAREAGTHDVDLHPQEESPQSADIFKALRFARSRHPVEPLLEGDWR